MISERRVPATNSRPVGLMASLSQRSKLDGGDNSDHGEAYLMPKDGGLIAGAVFSNYIERNDVIREMDPAWSR